MGFDPIAPLAGAEIPKGVPCTSLANLKPDNKSIPQNDSSVPKVSAWAAWGVQLLGDFTQSKVLARMEICGENILRFAETRIHSWSPPMAPLDGRKDT